jgi:putative hydrolases of HD superfamily
MERLRAQTEFLLTCDRLKSVARTTYLHDGSRPENSAEHSWHLALMALTFAEYAPANTNIEHAVNMLLVHDLVEIYAGDTYFDAAQTTLELQHAHEEQAASALFSNLPPGQGETFRALWDEFEVRRSPSALYARALDALQPMLLTWGEGGQGCSERGPDLTAQRILKLKESALRPVPPLWELAQRLVAEAVKAGIMPTEKTASPAQD